MKRISNILIVAALTSGAFLSACKEDHRKPGRIYVPDMYESRAYEFYNARLATMKPVDGTVKRGELLPYHLGEFDTAQANVNKNPLTITAQDLKDGKRFFNIYCAICHGTALDGNGPLYKGGDGPYPAKPANLVSGVIGTYSEGRLFHVATYGKNAMGSYASQLDREQRWKVAAYIHSMQPGAQAAAPDASAAGAKTDSTSAAK